MRSKKAYLGKHSKRKERAAGSVPTLPGQSPPPENMKATSPLLNQPPRTLAQAEADRARQEHHDVLLGMLTRLHRENGPAEQKTALRYALNLIKKEGEK